MENSNYKKKNIEKKYSNTRYDCFLNYIPEPIGKIVGVFKVFLTQTHLSKSCMGE